jgi:hypothetical protein
MARSLLREVLLPLAPNPQLTPAAVAPRQPPSKLLREKWHLTIVAQPHQTYQQVSSPREQLLTPLQKERSVKQVLSPSELAAASPLDLCLPRQLSILHLDSQHVGLMLPRA